MNNGQKEKIKNSFYDYVRSIGDEIIINNTIIYIENLLEEAKKEERDRLGELLFSKIIWTDDIAKIFKKGSICINCHNK